MILYQESQPHPEGLPPVWLEGAADLQRRDGGGMRWWGIGSGVLVGPQPTAKWLSCGKGLSVVVLRDFDPRPLARDQQWCPTTFAADLKGRCWAVPCVLSQSGDRQFRTAYGEDWLPKLTEEQTLAEATAKAARAAIIAAAQSGGTIPIQAACKWTADLLSCVNHVSPHVLAATGLVDDSIIAGTLYNAAGLVPRLEGADG